MVDKFDYLPGVLAEIAEVAGLVAALAVAEKLGGGRTHFPARAPDNHWLTDLVGREAADKICAHFRSTERGGIQVDIPLGPKGFYAAARRRALALMAEGVSTYETARRIGLDRSTVRRLKARHRAADQDKSQGRLF